MRTVAMIMVVLFSLIAGCGGDGEQDSSRAADPTPSATAATAETISARPTSIVGRWEVRRTCRGVVEALEKAGLRRIAPSVVGDYFPGTTPRQLARKADVCDGAKPQRHSHFFTEDGQFGSLDQDDGQVDDAPYRLVDARTLRLAPEFGEETYRYRIVGGEKLTLEPVVPTRLKRKALENPLEFSPAGHMAAVAYTGHTWKRVDCDGWC